jgi:hypothetical protein
MNCYATFMSENQSIMSKCLLFLIPFLLLSHCKNREPRTIHTAFHHWKSQLNVSAFEQSYCQQIKAQTLYLRLFDVDFNADNKFPEPLADLRFSPDTLLLFDKIIPTVFITNRTLINISDTQIDTLSTLIINKIRQDTDLSRDNREGTFFQNKVSELLIDCDWTAATKDKFFHLIQQLKTLTDKRITTTIRLHQIKFRDKTGIPPADKGLLMAYNTGDLMDAKTVNSILNIDVLRSYLAGLKTYPLPLDVALPIFSWGIVKRDGQAVQLIPNFSKAFLLKNSENGLAKHENTEGSLFQEKSTSDIEILKSGYFNGIYLYADDVIKIETITTDNLKAAATLLSQHLNNQHLTVSFFSLDTANLMRYKSEDLLEVAKRFK